MSFNKFGLDFNESTQKLARLANAHSEIDCRDRVAACVQPSKTQSLPAAYSSAQGIATYTAVTAYRNSLR